MYIKLTDRCNMKCAHCCFACTTKGADMDKDTFVAACKLAEERGDYFCLGGGEPTVHPQFWEFLGIAMKYAAGNIDDMPIWLATNGKKTSDALALAKLASQGIIGAALSQDDWHEPIDPRVVRAFIRSSSNTGQDWREIRHTKTIWRRGRGRQLAGSEYGCACSELFVDPRGNLRHCGCKNPPSYGTVFDPQIPSEVDFDTCGLKLRDLEPIH